MIHVITLILIGGHSSRMGRDKATIVRPDGRRQIDWLGDLARLAGGEVVLSVRQDSTPPVDLPVVIDAHPEAGPLAAFAAFHQHYPEKAALVLSCDLFLLDEETVKHLLAGRDQTRPVTCFANRLDGVPEPLCAIYEPAALSQAAGWLARGERGARRFVQALAPRVLDLPYPAALDSANTPHELAECFSKLQHGVTGKTVNVSYEGSLKESRGADSESVMTLANTIGGLYEELRFRFRLSRLMEQVTVSRNGVAGETADRIAEDDRITFRDRT